MRMPKIAVCCALALISLCACSRSRTITTNDGSVTVTDTGKDQASVKVNGKDGQTSVEMNSGKAITDYPSEVPLYSGKTVLDVKSAEKHARSLSIQSSDSADKISNFYKAGLESKGWKTDSSIAAGPMTMFTASKDTRELVIQIMSAEGKTTIMQHLGDKH